MALILVVDDDPSVTQLVRLYLEGTQYKVLEACNSFDAEEILYKYRVSLILVDINMPFQNGFDFVKKIRRSTRNKLTTISFLTSRSSQRDVKRALDLNVEGYILKPFEKNDFKTKIDEIFAKKRSQDPEYDYIDIKSQKYSGKIKFITPMGLESISEVGLTIISENDFYDSTRNIGCELTIDSPIWHDIKINPPTLVLNKYESLTDKKVRLHCIYKSLTYEEIRSIQEWAEGMSNAK